MTDTRKLTERIIREAEAAADGPEHNPLAAIERILREHHEELLTDVLEAMYAEDTEGWDPDNIVRREFRRVLEGGEQAVERDHDLIGEQGVSSAPQPAAPDQPQVTNYDAEAEAELIAERDALRKELRDLRDGKLGS